jgi:16S rRNA (cytosine1402-N4)-methyltransferase
MEPLQLTDPRHIPVLLQEVLEGLQCGERGIFLDCTVGCGGHTAAILARHPENYVIGLDRDPDALRVARERLASFDERVVLYHERFEHFETILQRVHRTKASLDGVLFDLGVSSLQLDDPQRGFSFQQAGRLDMRMDRQDNGKSALKTAYDVVNSYPADQLADLFFQYGEERQARRIARYIIEARKAAPIHTTTELADIVFNAIPKRFHPKGIHPATRVFQAIRIEVNGELQELGETLERAVQYLRPGGRIGVISFHSLEDRIVKRSFAKLAKGCQCPPDFPVCVCGIEPSLRIISKKPLVASQQEQAENPRCRSAKLRIAEKIGES